MKKKPNDKPKPTAFRLDSQLLEMIDVIGNKKYHLDKNRTLALKLIIKDAWGRLEEVA